MGTVVSIVRAIDGNGPTPEIRTVRRKAPGRKSNVEHGRDREYLTGAEVQRLMGAAQSHGRYGHRDATLILLCYRHGLRVSELISLKWSQVELKAARIHIVRAKHGISGPHPLTGKELRALRRLQRDQPTSTEFLFMSERGAPLAPAAVAKIVKWAGQRANIPFPVHPHMLRHSCGYDLVNRGIDIRTIQGYLGHASISNTVIYTQLRCHPL